MRGARGALHAARTRIPLTGSRAVAAWIAATGTLAGSLLVAAGIGGGGCIVVTDLGTGGYRLADAASCNEAGEGGCESSVCMSSADCASGQICCLLVTQSPSFTFACQMGPSCSGAQTVQLCSGDAECVSTTCTQESCPALAAVTGIADGGMLRTCGNPTELAGLCTPVP